MAKYGGAEQSTEREVMEQSGDYKNRYEQ